MPLIVQKFGGSSVADTDRIRRCAQRAYDAKRAGNDVVVVVSAMGKTTDKLIELAGEIRRHLDKGRVVVVAGFQGVTDDGQTTTLGRGGSDTTAVALAAALKAR